MKHSMKNTMLRLCLQFFAEGTGGAGGSSGGGAPTGGAASDAGLQTSGEGTAAAVSDKADDAGLENNGDDGSGESGADREAAFDDFITKNSDLFNARVKAKLEEILPGRTRPLTKKARGYDAMLPLIDTLTARYGTEPGDVEALIKAVSEDKTSRSARAEELGVSEDMADELERFRTREAAEKRQAKEVEAEEKYKRWAEESKAVKELYPSFDIRAEMKNPVFADLVERVGVKAAYAAVHHDEINKAAVRYVAKEASKRAEDNAVNKVRANGMRPRENGTGHRSPSTTRVDPSKLTKEQIDDYIRRAKAGEKISFS